MVFHDVPLPKWSAISGHYNTQIQWFPENDAPVKGLLVSDPNRNTHLLVRLSNTPTWLSPNHWLNKVQFHINMGIFIVNSEWKTRFTSESQVPSVFNSLDWGFDPIPHIVSLVLTGLVFDIVERVEENMGFLKIVYVYGLFMVIHGRFATKTARTKCNGFGKCTYWALFSSVWGYLGPIWGYVGPIWGMLAPCEPILGSCWAYVGPMLGLSWPIFGLYWPRSRILTPLKNMQKHRILEQKFPPQAKAY